MLAKHSQKFRYQALSLACISLLGISAAYPEIHEITSSNFTMLDPSGSIVGGATDVTGQFDDTRICSDASCTDAGGMELASTQPFFGLIWTAHDIRVFSPGTYTFDAACDATDIANGTTSCGGSAFLNMVVPEGALGAHILFDWGATKDIDVINQWDLNGAFGSPMYDGLCPGGLFCNTNHSPTAIWNLVSRDGDGFADDGTANDIQPDGLRGYGMVDGPFPNFGANFNLNMDPPFAFNLPPVANPVGASNNFLEPSNWEPSVFDPDGGPSALTCEIVDPPPVGQGIATVDENCGGASSYDPDGFPGPGTSFTYRAFDGQLYSEPATVTVAAAPSAGDVSITTTGTMIADLDLSVYITDADNNQDLSTLNISTPADNGDAAVIDTNGNVQYQANDFFTGIDRFGYKVKDTDNNESNEGTVSVAILAEGPASSTAGYQPGPLAASLGSPDGGGLGTEYGTLEEVGMDDEMEQQCVGGCWDFEVDNAGLADGDPVTVVIPLGAGIPDGAVVRKKIGDVWSDFVTDSNNAASTATAISDVPLVCPGAGSTAYVAGLTPGKRCLRLKIENNNINNDADPSDIIVADPGGVGVPMPPVAPPSSVPDPNIGGGCSLDNKKSSALRKSEWWLMAGLLAWLGIRRRIRTN